MGASTFIVKIGKRGSDMPGLMRYLYGPGQANEHTDQRMIAGTDSVRFAFPGELDAREASELGRHLEASWRQELADARELAGIGIGGVTRGAAALADPRVTRDVEAAGAPHVYHFIISLPPGASWTDEQFATVAGEYVKRLGFSEGEDDDLGCRWSAVRHGLSAGGNDHVHVAVNLVRQDGRRAQVPNRDFVIAQNIRRDLERELDFVTPLHDRDRTPGKTMPGYTMAEHYEAKKSGAIAPDRVLLQQHLHAAAAAAGTQAEWLRAVADLPGVQVAAARWTPGNTPAVSGYVARIGSGRWYAASQLAPDLTLAKLGARWSANETASTLAEAATLWHSATAAAERIGGLEGAPALPAVSIHIDAAEAALARWAQTLEDTPRTDQGQLWDDATTDLAGISAALTVPSPSGVSVPVSPTEDRDRSALVRATQTAAQEALARQYPTTPRPAGGPTVAQIAARQVQIALRAGGLHSHPGWVAVLQQMARAANAIRAARHARDELAAAHRLAQLASTWDTTARHVHATYGDADLDGLRETWHTRDLTRTHHAATHTARPTYPNTNTAPAATNNPGRVPYIPAPDQTRSRGL